MQENYPTMFKQSLLIIYLTSFWAVSFLTAQNSFPTQKIDQLLEAQIKGVDPGFAVGIVQNGNIVYEHYLGYANLEHQVPVDKKTRFNIASNAKQFTALCILDLVQKDQLSLEDDMRKYLKDYFPDIQTPIQIKHLLNHTSGIRDVYDLWALQGETWWAMPLGNNDAFNLLKKQKALNFAPGTDYLYSNSNYILLTELVKVISGEKFADYADALFKELGLEELAFLTNYMDIMPNKARPYAEWGGWKEYPILYGIHGDGALFSNLQAQLQWEILLQTPPKGKKGELIRQSQTLVPETQNQQYGFGVEHVELDQQSFRFHEGSTGAYHASFIRFPQEALAVVVITNNAGISTYELSRSIAGLLLDDPELSRLKYPIQPIKTGTAPDRNSLTGSYELPDGTIIGIEMNGNQLRRMIHQSDPVALIQQKGNWYQYENNPALNIAFYPDAQVPHFVLYHPELAPRKALKLNIEPTFPKSEKLVGHYYNEEIDGSFTVEHLQGQDFRLLYNGATLEAKQVLPNILLTQGYRLNVKRNKKGQIEGFLLDGGRLKAVFFEKETE